MSDTAPAIEPEIKHLDFDVPLDCDCKCHKDGPEPAVNVLIIHERCRIMLLCAGCTLTKERALQFVMSLRLGLGVWCPFCARDCASFDDLYKVVPL